LKYFLNEIIIFQISNCKFIVFVMIWTESYLNIIESHLKSKQIRIKLLILYSVKIADFAYFLQVRNITVYNKTRQVYALLDENTAVLTKIIVALIITTIKK